VAPGSNLRTLDLTPRRDDDSGKGVAPTSKRQKQAVPLALRLFEVGVVVPTIVGLVVFTIQDFEPFRADAEDLIIWTAVVALVEMVPLPVWRGIVVSLAMPMLMAVAFLYTPLPTGVVALAGSFDPRELRGELDPLRALFNRCQIALSALGASFVFHEFASINGTAVAILVLAAMGAAIADYVINMSLVTIGASLLYHIPPVRVIRELKVGTLSEFVVSFLGLGTAGLLLAKFFTIEGVGFWAVPMFVLPLLLARQMFYRTRALEQAHKELQDREQVLRALSNRMAEERQDERETIAAYLHDDLAQLLFKLSIQVDIARRHLAAGKLPETETTLNDIRETKTKTADRIRALIRDLHRSPLGRAGLAEALEGFIDETARGSAVRFHTDIDEIPLPPPIALLVYHIAREGVMNALKHADASNVWVTVKQQGDIVVLTLRDDGGGFDVEAPPPEGHFGLTMMRERALVGGGTYELKSEPGEGTTITVRFPTSWLQQQEPPPGEAATGDGGGPGTARSPEDDPAPQSVLA
jgi:signal transduction histidine kinase